MSLSKEKGKRLKEARTDAHLTQPQLGKMAGYTPQFISAMENGKKNLSFEAAHNFAKILHVQPEWLLAESDFKTLQDKSSHLNTSYRLENGIVAMHLRDWGCFTVSYDEDEDKFIIVPNDKDWIELFYKGFDLEDERPLICTSKELEKFEKELVYIQTQLYTAFLRVCDRGTQKDREIATDLQQKRESWLSKITSNDETGNILWEKSEDPPTLREELTDVPDEALRKNELQEIKILLEK